MREKKKIFLEFLYIKNAYHKYLITSHKNVNEKYYLEDIFISIFLNNKFIVLHQQFVDLTKIEIKKRCFDC